MSRDHASEARHLINELVGKPTESTHATPQIASAQVHATLALVEQVKRLADAGGAS